MPFKDMPFIMPALSNGRDPDKPLYSVLYDAIRQAILSCELNAGARLPASRALASYLGISRMTVINAYDQLLAEGYLEGKAGSGTFVASSLPEEFLQLSCVAKTANVTLPERKLDLTDYGANLLRDFDSVICGNGETRFTAFQHGLPAMDAFPYDAWGKLYAKNFQLAKKDVFGYGDPAGLYALRSAIANHLKSARGVNCEPDQVIITSGAQQAFDLTAKVLLKVGDTVMLENPCHTGAKNSFGLPGTKILKASIDDEGIDFERAVKKGAKPKLVYVTPSHQFPLGVTMSLSRRFALLEWAKNNSAWIIEDDYDSEFRYAGRPLASLQGLDNDNRVIYVGTFSKTIYPALRLGCVVVPKDLVKVFTAARALSGGNSPTIDQAVLAEFISEGYFARHIRKMRRLYQDRQELLITEMEKHLAGKMTAQRMDAGMHIIAYAADVANEIAIFKAARDAGIKLTFVSGYDVGPRKSRGLILGYAGITEKQIKDGVRKLVKVVDGLAK